MRALRRRRVPSPSPSAPPRRAGRARAAGPTTRAVSTPWRSSASRKRVITASFDSGRRARFRLRCHATSAHAGPRPASAQSMRTSRPSGSQPRFAHFTSPCTSVAGVSPSARTSGVGSAWSAKTASATRGARSAKRLQPSPIARGTALLSPRAASSSHSCGRKRRYRCAVVRSPTSSRQSHMAAWSPAMPSTHRGVLGLGEEVVAVRDERRRRRRA